MEKEVNNQREGVAPIVKDLADSFTLHSRSKDRIWISIAVIIIYSMQASFTNEAGLVVNKLPFGFGEIENSIFDTIALFVLSFMSIIFCSAYSHAMDIHRRAHKIIDNLEDSEKQRDFFDNMTPQTISRIGPIMLNERQSSRFKLVSRAYYPTIRMLFGIVIFIIPLYGLSVVWIKLLDNPVSSTFFKILGTTIMFLAMLTLSITMTAYGKNFSRKLTNIKSEDSD